MTIQEKLNIYIEKLSTIYPDYEAENIANWAFEHIFSFSKTELHFSKNKQISAEKESELNEILQRLLTHEPIQHIVKIVDFYTIKLNVNKHTLIPRPETEELVDWVVKEHKNRAALRILDIGTGSGCIAISLKKNLPQANVTAIDISAEALIVAKENAILNNAAVTFLQLDFLQEKLSEKFDIIVSNPPYIGYEEAIEMRDNVKLFEPEIALFANDPLIFYKKIAADYANLLVENGCIYLELNEKLAKETATLFTNKNTIIRQDIYGKDRMLKVY